MININCEDEHSGIFKSPVDFKKLPENVPVHEYILQKVRENLQRHGDGIWLTDCATGSFVRFSEVEQKTLTIGNALWALGLRPGNSIYFSTFDITSLCLVMMGAWSCNASVRGGCPDDTADDIASQIRDSRCTFVLCEPDTANKIKLAVQQVDWEVALLSVGDVEGATSVAELLRIKNNDDSKKYINFNPCDDVVHVFSTSGSTGLPKGAPHTHQSLITYLSWEDHVIPRKPTMYTSRNYHVTGFMYPFTLLMLGTPAYGFSKFDNQLILRCVQEYKPQVLGTFPTFVVWLSKTPLLSQYDLSSIQIIMASGAKLDVASQRLMLARLPSLHSVQRMYGLSENIVIVSTVVGLHFDKDGDCVEETEVPLESTGVLLPGVTGKVVDVETKESVAPNVRGELLIKSPTSIKGYLNRIQESKDLFDEDGWQKTGDCANYDEAGNIYIVERLKEIFKYQAHHVSPSELEGVLRTHPDVLDAGVTAVPNPEVGSLPRAYVIRNSTNHLSEKDLRLYMDERTANYKHLRGGIIFVDSLPSMPNGKLSRIGLRQLVQNEMK